MVATHEVPPGEYVHAADQRILLQPVTWMHFETQLALRGEAPVPRMAYLEGVLELMSPSKDHERIKSLIGRLIETYAVERDITLSPYGGWTLKQARRAAGVEPDECYIIGPDQSAEVPDLAIEVVWTSGGLDKLEIYRRLGVREVWFWRDERIEVYVLKGEAYELATASICLPGIDTEVITALLDRPALTDAVREYRALLRR